MKATQYDALLHTHALQHLEVERIKEEIEPLLTQALAEPTEIEKVMDDIRVIISKHCIFLSDTQRDYDPLADLVSALHEDHENHPLFAQYDVKALYIALLPSLIENVTGRSVEQWEEKREQRKVYRNARYNHPTVTGANAAPALFMLCLLLSRASQVEAQKVQTEAVNNNDYALSYFYLWNVLTKNCVSIDATLPANALYMPECTSEQFALWERQEENLFLREFNITKEQKEELSGGLIYLRYQMHFKDAAEYACNEVPASYPALKAFLEALAEPGEDHAGLQRKAERFSQLVATYPDILPIRANMHLYNLLAGRETIEDVWADLEQQKQHATSRKEKSSLIEHLGGVIMAYAPDISRFSLLLRNYASLSHPQFSSLSFDISHFRFQTRTEHFNADELRSAYLQNMFLIRTIRREIRRRVPGLERLLEEQHRPAEYSERNAPEEGEGVDAREATLISKLLFGVICQLLLIAYMTYRWLKGDATQSMPPNNALVIRIYERECRNYGNENAIEKLLFQKYDRSIMQSVKTREIRSLTARIKTVLAEPATRIELVQKAAKSIRYYQFMRHGYETLISALERLVAEKVHAVIEEKMGKNVSASSSVTSPSVAVVASITTADKTAIDTSPTKADIGLSKPVMEDSPVLEQLKAYLLQKEKVESVRRFKRGEYVFTFREPDSREKQALQEMFLVYGGGEKEWVIDPAQGRKIEENDCIALFKKALKNIRKKTSLEGKQEKISKPIGTAIAPDIANENHNNANNNNAPNALKGWVIEKGANSETQEWKKLRNLYREYQKKFEKETDSETFDHANAVKKQRFQIYLHGSLCAFLDTKPFKEVMTETESRLLWEGTVHGYYALLDLPWKGASKEMHAQWMQFIKEIAEDPTLRAVSKTQTLQAYFHKICPLATGRSGLTAYEDYLTDMHILHELKSTQALGLQYYVPALKGEILEQCCAQKGIAVPENKPEERAHIFCVVLGEDIKQFCGEKAASEYLKARAVCYRQFDNAYAKKA